MFVEVCGVCIGVYAALIFISLAYLFLRSLIFSNPFNGGTSYFTSGRITRVLTMSRFFFGHYFFPALSGCGLCSDFSRPLIADASLSSISAWSSLAVLICGLSFAFYFLFLKRASWAFWVIFPFLFLLPTSNLILPLDTIGAQRFLYIPSVALCVCFGAFWNRFEKKWWGRMTATLLLLWQSSQAFSQSFLWTTPVGFYAAAVSCNPVSSSAQSSLGAAWLEIGQSAKGIPFSTRVSKPCQNFFQRVIGKWRKGKTPPSKNTAQFSCPLFFLRPRSLDFILKFSMPSIFFCISSFLACFGFS